MADNISVYVDALDNDAKFRLIDLNEKAHTVPKTAKEKELAAMGHPKDKITHKDILIGRGVLSREEAERIAEKVEELEEAPKGVLHKVSYTYDDPSGKGIASGAVKLHAPDKEAAKRYAARDLAHRKNVKITSARQIAEQEEAEQIDELSKDTLNRYVEKSSGDMGYRMRTGQLAKASKRLTGSARAQQKIKEDTHYCAKHVFSERFGEGVVVEGAHAEPDENGLIEWYDVDFGGTVRRVMTEKVKVMHAEYHMNHKRKKMSEEDKTHTVPKTAKEKDLAAAAEPKDKITHKDVLVKRGVVNQAEEVQIEEANGGPLTPEHFNKDDKLGHEHYKEYTKHMMRNPRSTHVSFIRGESVYGRPGPAGAKKLADAITAAHKRYTGVKEEVDLDEAKSIKVGDFVRNAMDGKIHRVFDVRGNTLHTGEYHGKDAYGGDSILHKTKAVKVPRPADVTEEVELDEVEQVDELSSGTIDSYRKKLGAKLDTKPAYTSAAKSAQQQTNDPIRAKIHNALMKQHQAIRRERGMSEEVELEEAKSLAKMSDAEIDDAHKEARAKIDAHNQANPFKPLPRGHRLVQREKTLKLIKMAKAAQQAQQKEEVELEEAMHSPFRKAAMALRNKSFDPKNSSDDRATYSLHADLLSSKDPKHHEASAKMMGGHDTYMRDQISDTVHQNSSKENSAKYHKMGGVKRLK